MDNISQHDKNTISRIQKIQSSLQNTGHKGIGDWLVSEISNIYNSKTFKSKIEVGTKPIPGITGHNDNLRRDTSWSQLHGASTNNWLKRKNSKNTKTSYLFLPSEINQRIALMEIFNNFDADGNNKLELEEFLDMFINNYISKIDSDRNNEVDLDILLNKTSKFKVQNFSGNGDGENDVLIDRKTTVRFSRGGKRGCEISERGEGFSGGSRSFQVLPDRGSE
jgi:hypothetical protein